MEKQIEAAWKATQLDQVKVLASLVPTHVRPNCSTCDPKNLIHTLLMCACAHGSRECAKYLIERCSVNVDAKNCRGDTAFHWAAYAGRDEMIPILLAGKADSQARNQDGETPLHVASARGHEAFVRALLENDSSANVNALTSIGWTALHYAVKSNQKAAALVLVEKGIDASAVDANGKTINDLAGECGRHWFEKISGR